MLEFLRYLKDPLNQEKIKQQQKNWQLKNLENFKENPCTPISSQAHSEEWEGSETRAYDPERIMKLQERLGQIELELFSEYYIVEK